MRTAMTTIVCAGLMMIVATPAAADWDPGDGHKMHWPQLPDPNGWDVAFYPPGAVGSLADDWRCSQSGPVSDIHFWVSFHQWNDPAATPPIAPFKIRIRADVPDPDGSGPLYSQPGAQLWEQGFDPNDGTGAVTIRHGGSGDQGWFDPSFGSAVPSDHTEYYQINVAPINNPFLQDVGKIYWLEIEMAATTPDHPIGWKTSGSPHFNDDGVFGGPPPQMWNELRDPLTQESLDLAFVITPEPTTLAFLSLGGLVALRRRRNRRVDH